MHLSLYLLLAPSTDTEQPPGVDHQPEQKVEPKVRQDFVQVYSPLQSGRAGSRRLVQASRNNVLVPARRGTTVQSVGFGVSVVVNALGFLVITTAALSLLQVAEISLF